MVDAFALAGSGAKYSPCRATAADRSAFTTPGWTTARRFGASMSRILVMRENTSTIPPARGIEPPLNPVPAPRGTSGTFRRDASRAICETCSAVSGNTITSGVPVDSPASYSYSMRSSGWSRTASAPTIFLSSFTTGELRMGG